MPLEYIEKNIQCIYNIKYSIYRLKKSITPPDSVKRQLKCLLNGNKDSVDR